MTPSNSQRRQVRRGWSLCHCPSLSALSLSRFSVCLVLCAVCGGFKALRTTARAGVVGRNVSLSWFQVVPGKAQALKEATFLRSHVAPLNIAALINSTKECLQISAVLNKFPGSSAREGNIGRSAVQTFKQTRRLSRDKPVGMPDTSGGCLPDVCATGVTRPQDGTHNPCT